MKNAKLYALVGLLTLGNVAFRVANAQQSPPAQLVSHVEAGDRVESVELTRLVADARVGSEACHLVVAFNPACPFCKAAAEREKEAARDGTWGETLWITDEEWPRLADFVRELPDGSRHAVLPEAFQALDVDAVPALFMLDREGTVRWVGPYRGDETGDELALRCEEPAVPVKSAEGVTAEGGIAVAGS